MNAVNPSYLLLLIEKRSWTYSTY